MHLSRASSPSLILQTKTPKDGLPYDLYLAEPTTCHSNDAVTTISTKFNRSNLEFDLVGSINGLLCLSEPLYFDPVYICNPIIGEYMTLPKSEIETGFDIVSGFGFDQSTDRYKVIIMLYVTVKDDPTTTNGTVSFRMEGEIYTVGGSGEWRRIGEVPYPLRARESEAYLNGVLHWLMTDQDIGIETCEFIGSFDVASEEFRSLPPPQTQFSSESRTSLRRLNLDLGVLGDELCIFDNYFSDRTEIWMMKDYGVQSSWTKQYVIKRPRDIGIETCEFIGAFDVASEEFRSLPPPQTQFSSESRTSLRRLNLNLGVLGDELCIFDNYFSDRMEIWMMKAYGVQSSWTKQYVIKRPRSLEVQQDTRVYFKPLKLTHNGEILMLYDSVAIVCYDPVGKFFYHLGLFGLPVATNVCKAIVHVGSLVSLRNVAANEGENSNLSNTAVDKSVKRSIALELASLLCVLCADGHMSHAHTILRKISDIPYGTWDTILYPIPTHELDICKWLAEKGVALHIGRLDRPAVPR
ncbi:hypothetical protein TEA_010305 [Camellia sinensis var. sinensis]|uniref:F-box associated beta-propeller type 3 domain-containing protein n=1 Tax=Camellia sinensis var. sinensis TaxID=542762 RepID=A0A4S4DFQ0_CAMSN|nr:hypothetical protein TEA_010305 [Camellia sinensis var. sinensis]